MKGSSILFLCLFVWVQLYAANLYGQQKIGYIDTDYILLKMPEYQGIEQQLRSVAQEWRNELNRMQEEINGLKETFEARKVLYTEEIRRQREQEINEKIQQREQYMEEKFGAQGEYFARQKKLLEPVQRKLYEAIDRIARRQNFDLVFDRSAQTTLLYGKPEWNLNEEVLMELGLESNEISN